MYFFTLLLLSFLLGLVIFFILNKNIKKTNRYKAKFIDTSKFLMMSDEKKLDLINLGSSHPKYAFDYSTLNIDAENWAVGPQSLEYDFYMLQKYHNRLHNGSIVIIPLCVFSFFLYRYLDPFKSVKYYDVLDAKFIFNYSSKLYKSEIKYPLYYHPRAVKALLKDSPIDLKLDLRENPMSLKEIEKDADSWIDCWENEFKIDLNNLILSEENRSNIEKNIAILSQMIEFCTKNSYKPVIMLLPLTNELGSKFTDEFVDNQILSYIDNANLLMAPVYNFLHDSRFTSRDLYVNSFFFNKKGRILFTRTVVEILKENHLI